MAMIIVALVITMDPFEIFLCLDHHHHHNLPMLMPATRVIHPILMRAIIALPISTRPVLLHAVKKSYAFLILAAVEAVLLHLLIVRR
jgi:hypothetical protein